MKTLLSLLAIIFAVQISYAQWSTSGGNTTTTDNVGIGTTSPTATLHIVKIASGDIGPRIVLENPVSAATNNAAELSFLLHSGLSLSTYNASIKAFEESSNGYTAISFGTYGGSAAPSERMRITSQGDVGIGTSDPQGHKLAVNGDIIATKVKVLPYANWPDYVFKPQYHLPSLSDVKTYIDQNQHLPDMPSEKDVAKDGVDLGDMVKLQTKKIEELTLYLIEKDKELKDQHDEIKELKALVQELVKQK